MEVLDWSAEWWMDCPGDRPGCPDEEFTRRVDKLISEVRAATLREARDAAANEHLQDDTGCPEDVAYDEGVYDAVQAIERLMAKEK
jgi:hypothetical protein